jgi:hypothetical protein
VAPATESLPGERVPGRLGVSERLEDRFERGVGRDLEELVGLVRDARGVSLRERLAERVLIHDDAVALAGQGRDHLTAHDDLGLVSHVTAQSRLDGLALALGGGTRALDGLEFADALNVREQGRIVRDVESGLAGGVAALFRGGSDGLSPFGSEREPVALSLYTSSLHYSTSECKRSALFDIAESMSGSAVF